MSVEEARSQDPSGQDPSGRDRSDRDLEKALEEILAEDLDEDLDDHAESLEEVREAGDLEPGDDEQTPVVNPREEGTVRGLDGVPEREEEDVDGLREGEFVCSSCRMAKRESALADPERLLCRDCV